MLDTISGLGTQKNPYQITNVKQLKAVREDLSAHYELANDIDAEENFLWKIISDGFRPIGNSDKPFTGTFNGNNHQISNLYIGGGKQETVGLFGCNNGQIKNVGLTNLNVYGASSVGGLVGKNYGIVESSYVRGGKISGPEFTGGLVGSNKSTVRSSHSEVDVSGKHSAGGLVGNNDGKTSRVQLSYAKGNISGDRYIGGLVGNNKGSIESSCVQGTISGHKIIGGLVGWNDGNVESSCSTCGVSGKDYLGDVVGGNYRNGKVSSSFSFSNRDGDTILGFPDLEISTDKWSLSYFVEIDTLCLEINSEDYICTQVSTTEAQSLSESFEDDVVRISNRFKSSVVMSA